MLADAASSSNSMCGGFENEIFSFFRQQKCLPQNNVKDDVVTNIHTDDLKSSPSSYKLILTNSTGFCHKVQFSKNYETGKLCIKLIKTLNQT